MLGGLRLFGGLAVLVLVGVIVSPRTREGANIFLDQRNLFDILERVSNVGILAVGMTLVILTGGIDLSVGSVLSLGTVVAAMLLLERGWHGGARLAAPALVIALALVAGTVVPRLLPERVGPALRARVSGAAFLLAGAAAAAWAAHAAPRGLPIPWLVASVMALGLLVGSLNGLLVAYGGLQPFIATLATMISIWGLAWIVPGEANARRHISTASDTSYQAFNWLGTRITISVPAEAIVVMGIALVAPLLLLYLRPGRRAGQPRRLVTGPNAGICIVLGLLSGLLASHWRGALRSDVPVPGIFFLGVVLSAHVVLRYTELGRRIYAIGGSEDAARLSGVPVAATKVLIYGISGLLAALTGTLWAAQYHQGFPDAGQGAELDAIAAVVIGGTSLMGGRGGVPGTFMGVLMLGVLNNILMLKEYTTNWQRLVTGAIIALAVLLQQERLQTTARRAVASWLKSLRGTQDA
jgi:simple sugar transport system permease protein